MITKTIRLREDNPNITLDVYLPAPLDFVGPRPAIIVCPGGGYGFLSPNEGEPVALRFVSMGYNAFVLHYSVQANTPAEKLSWPEPLYDLASAVLSIREHAAEWTRFAGRWLKKYLTIPVADGASAPYPAIAR